MVHLTDGKKVLLLCILILVMGLILVIGFICWFMKLKGKKKTIIGASVGLLLLSVFYFFVIRYANANKEFYQYKRHIMKTFNYVYDVGLENIGPDCIIEIYVKDKQVDYGTIEPIFIEAMKEIYQESLFPYLVKKQNGDILFLDIFISNNQRKTEHRFVSTGDFEIWEYEGDRSKKFKVSDYVE